jgi:hypothetical protein
MGVSRRMGVWSVMAAKVAVAAAARHLARREDMRERSAAEPTAEEGALVPLKPGNNQERKE